jgi:hypothetical protein
MKKRNREIRKIEEALSCFFGRSQKSAPLQPDSGTSGEVREDSVHRTQPAEPEPTAVWQQRVMAKVREEASGQNIRPAHGVEYHHTVWRFALAGSLVMVLFSVYCVYPDLQHQYQIAEFLLDDAASIDLAHSFGML